MRPCAVSGEREILVSKRVVLSLWAAKESLNWRIACYSLNDRFLARMSAHPYDEMTSPDQGVRPHYRAFADWLERTDTSRIAQKREEAERAFHRVGITFAVYGDDGGTERLIPFDIVPRIIPADEWTVLERGLKQRVRALNLFLADVYHDQRIL